MNMDTFIALLAAFGGTAGLVTAISGIVFKVIDYRKAKRGETIEARLEPILKQIQAQQAELHEIRLDTLRTQLYIKIEHEPKNHDTILKIAHRYFVEYGGDWVATTDFQAWADREHIKIPLAIMQAIAKNDHK